MRLLLIAFVLAAIAGVVSAITGIASFEADSRTGTVVEYWHGYERLYAVGTALSFAIASYGIYRRFPFVWKIGFVVIYLSAAQFVFQVWWFLWPQPSGWIGAVFATVCAPFIALYWASWWRRQRPYFLPDVAEQT
jgi:hypothetical protein